MGKSKSAEYTRSGGFGCYHVNWCRGDEAYKSNMPRKTYGTGDVEIRNVADDHHLDKKSEPY